MGDIGVRYFRSSAEVYEAFRASLDAAYGYPNLLTLTETAIPPAAEAPKGKTGLVYIAATEEYCGFDLPARLLTEAIAAGAVEEIDEETYAWETL